MLLNKALNLLDAVSLVKINCNDGALCRGDLNYSNSR